ncbi:hypothetical protein D3C76_1880990 [compost metagenome]
MQTIVTAGDEQEDRNNGVDGRAVKIADAGIMGGESPNRDGGKAVADSIKGRHSGEPQRQRTGDG